MRGKAMGFGLIAAGFVFLANPCYNLIDFLPDFIGFFLIYRGLLKISALDSDLEDSRTIFSHLALIDFSKILVFFLLAAGRNGSALGPDGTTLDALSIKASNDTYYLVVTLVYAVVEVIFFVSAVNKLFLGVDGVSGKYSSGYPGKASQTRAVIIAFFTVRCAVSVVSELPALFLSSRYGDVPSGGIPPENMRPYLYVIGSVVVVLFSVFFIYYSVRFFSKLRRNEELILRLKEAYSRFGKDNPLVRLGNRMRNAAILFTASTFLSVWITNEGMTVIPGAFCSVFIIMTAIMLKDGFRRKTGFLSVVITGTLYGVVSSLSYVFESRFFSDYSRFETFRLKGANSRYLSMAITEEIGFFLLAFSMIALSFTFFRTVRSHVTKAGGEFYVSDKITFQVDRYRRELDGALRKRITLCKIAMIAHFAFLPVVPVFEPFVPTLFPPYFDGAREVDVPGQVMSYVTLAYFIISALMIIFILNLCMFSNAEMYRPMAKKEKV